jgi:hypothetical protein
MPGRLALLLVWGNPKYKVITKIIVTMVAIVATILFCRLGGYINA